MKFVEMLQGSKWSVVDSNETYSLHLASAFYFKLPFQSPLVSEDPFTIKGKKKLFQPSLHPPPPQKKPLHMSSKVTSQF